MATMTIDHELTHYIRQLDGDLLTAEQEREIGWRIIRHNDPVARERMIRANLRLVVYVARRFKDRKVSMADLVAEGNIGLLRAVDSFDPDRGVRFSTYAIWWIKQSMRIAVAKADQVIHVPTNMIHQIAKWRRTSQQLNRLLNREPSNAELSAGMRLSSRRLRAIQIAARLLRGATYISTGAIDNGVTPAQSMRGNRSTAPDEAASHTDDTLMILKLLDHIDQREATVLRLHFGLDRPSPMTLREIGAQLGVTQERVRQLRAKALRTLKERLESDESPAAVTPCRRGDVSLSM